MITLKNSLVWPCVLLLLGLFLFQAGYFALTSSTVSDEVAHIGAGYSYVKFDNFELNLEHPPLVKEIAAIPLLFMDLKFPLESQAWQDKEQWTLGRAFLYTTGNPAEKMIAAARLALMVLPVFLGLVLFNCCRTYWGTAAALFALVVYAYFPELIAHSLLVTTDFAAAAFFFSTVYFYIVFQDKPSVKKLIAVGISLGLALASKYSTIQLIPLLYLAAVMYGLEKGRPQIPSLPKAGLILLSILAVSHKYAVPILLPPVLFAWFRTFFPQKAVFKKFNAADSANILLWVFLAAFLVILIVYFDPVSWFRHYHFNPLKKFFRGWTIFRDHAKGDTHRGFLFGEYRQAGWWYYYPAAMLFKIPIPILFFSGLGTVKIFFEKKISRTGIYFLIPAAFYLFIACFLNKVNIGVRHVLPLYPFLILLAVQGFLWLKNSRSRALRIFTVGALCLWFKATAFTQFPNYLSYFNELTPVFGGKEHVLGDSNISWGQDLMRLRDYVKRNRITELGCVLQFNTPDEIKYYGIPYSDGTHSLRDRRPGIYVVDVYSYQSLSRDPAYAWLAARRPDDFVGGSLWIYKF